MPPGFARTRLAFSVLLVAVWANASLAVADDSVDRLVRLVGRDAGLCVEIPRLEETVTAFEQGEFFQRLQRSRIYADWQSGSEYRHARGIVSVIEHFTGKSFRQFFHDMFGRAVVVGVYAEPGPEMSAIMLTETSSREALDAVIEGWNRAETQQTDAIEFAGQTYYKRTCSAKSGPGTMVLFYCKLDRTLMLTDREEWIRRSLTLARDPGESESLLGLPAYQEARKSLQGGQAARAYVNPRAWDRVLGFSHAPDSKFTSATSSETSKTSSPASAATTPTPPPAGFTKALEAAWKRCEWLALGLQVDRGIVVEAVARYSMDGISERGRQWIRSMSGPADFLRLIPHDALVAVAGRQAFGDLLKHLAPQNEAGALDSVRQVSRGLLLGLDPFEDVLPAFRENFGAYLVPRKDAKPDDLPIDGLVAAELPPVETTISPRAGFTPTAGSSATSNVTPERPPTFRDALDNGLNIGLNLAAAYFRYARDGQAGHRPNREQWTNTDSLGRQPRSLSAGLLTDVAIFGARDESAGSPPFHLTRRGKCAGNHTVGDRGLGQALFPERKPGALHRHGGHPPVPRRARPAVGSARGASAIDQFR